MTTTVPDKAATCARDNGPRDPVDRQFNGDRPNMLWVPGFTYDSMMGGFVYVAFVIDALVRNIVG